MSDHDFGDTQTGGVEGTGEGRGRVGILRVRASNSRVHQRNNATEFRGGGQSRITTNVGDADHKGVEVLLSSNQLLGGRDDGRVGTQGRDDLVRKRELGARVGGGQETARDATSQSGSFTGVSKVAERTDGGDRNLFLAETSLGDSHEGRDGGDFGIHGVGRVLG